MAREPVYDKHGRQIMVGDLLRSFHFKDGRRNTYLYHGVVETPDCKAGETGEKWLEAVSVQTLCGLKPEGGRFWILPGTCDRWGIEIVCGPIINGRSWYERPKRILPPTNQTGD